MWAQKSSGLLCADHCPGAFRGVFLSHHHDACHTTPFLAKKMKMHYNREKNTDRETTKRRMKTIRKIIHADCDAFYASIEQRDHPTYRGKPVIVGSDPDKRGVVSTASYEARAYGVHSAQSAKTARRLCPHAIFLRPRFEVYKAVSQEILSIYRDYTSCIEPLSLDEFSVIKLCKLTTYLEVKPTKSREQLNLTRCLFSSFSSN